MKTIKLQKVRDCNGISTTTPVIIEKRISLPGHCMKMFSHPLSRNFATMCITIQVRHGVARIRVTVLKETYINGTASRFTLLRLLIT